MSFTAVGGGLIASLPVKIAPGTTVTEKRDAILKAIKDNKVPKFTAATKGTDGLTVTGLTKGTVVRFAPGTTGEAKDGMVASLTPGGSIGFGGGIFTTLDYSGQPADFTAGLITDKGTLSETITSEFLGITPGSSQTVTGTQVTQALYNLLQPEASLFGATVSEQSSSSSSFNVLLDPAFAQGDSGILFGTTSQSSGAFGSLIAPAAVPEASSVVSLGLMLALGLGGIVAARKKARN